MDDATVSFVVNGKEYALRFSKNHTVSSVKNHAFYRDFDQFDIHRELKLARIANRGVAVLVRSETIESVETKIKACGALKYSANALDASLTIIMLDFQVLESPSAETQQQPVREIDVTLTKPLQLINYAISCSNNAYFGIANSSRMVPQEFENVFNALATQLYAGENCLVVNNCDPPVLLFLLSLLPEIPEIHLIVERGSTLEVKLVQSLKQAD